MDALLSSEVAEPTLEETSVPPVESSVLFDRFRHGDETAFTELYRREHRVVLSVVLTYIHHFHTAEDVAQDCWIKMVKGADTFVEGGSFRNWMSGVVRNNCLDALRMSKRRKRRFDHAVSLDEEQMKVDSPLNIHHAFHLLEIEEQVNAVLGRIRGDYAQLLRLRFMESKPLNDIALTFGKSEATMRFHLEKASNSFRLQYAPLLAK